MPEENCALSEELQNKIRNFIQDNDALRASRTVRAVFFDYLRSQEGLTDINFDTIINDVEAVIVLMESIADESKNVRDNLI